MDPFWTPSLSEIKKYFEEAEWDSFSEFDKKRYISIMENYNIMKDLDLNPEEPDFVKRKREADLKKEKRASHNSEKTKIEKKRKPVFKPPNSKLTFSHSSSISQDSSSEQGWTSTGCEETKKDEADIGGETNLSLPEFGVFKRPFSKTVKNLWTANKSCSTDKENTGQENRRASKPKTKKAKSSDKRNEKKLDENSEEAVGIFTDEEIQQAVLLANDYEDMVETYLSQLITIDYANEIISSYLPEWLSNEIKAILNKNKFKESSKTGQNDNFESQICLISDPAPNLHYEASSESDEDRLIYCDVCQKEWMDFCPQGHQTLVKDKKEGGTAEESLPAGLSLARSSVKQCGLGVWSTEELEAGTIWGPLRGRHVPASSHNNGYIWEIKFEGKVQFCIDGSDVNASNWMRYVNCARTETERSGVAFQYKREIYFRTCRRVEPSTEILVFYNTQLKIASLSYFTKRSYPCGSCIMAFSSLQYLEKHKKRSHRNMDGAGEGSTDLQHLQTNEMRNTRPNRLCKNIQNCVSPCVCNICNKAFTTSGDLTKHKRIHSGDRPYVCNICNKAFTQPCSLTTHNRIHSGDRPYVCNICNKAFIRSDSLTTHNRIHSGDRPYVCNICNKAFTTSGSLTTHNRIHSGDRPYVCNICNKAFTESGSLTTHNRIHSGDRPYVCNICNKAFTQPCSLTTHNRIHSGDRPYVCNICNKAFTESGSLTTHNRIHSGDRPYVCNICNKAFRQASNLRTHKRVHMVANYKDVTAVKLHGL